jgi:[acyl-carrier-protein] S-malonyltransferase
MNENSDRTVFMFPGQGSQHVGMRHSAGTGDESTEALYRHAEEVLDLPLRRIMDEGPIEELTRTSHAQPALLMAGVVAARAVEARGTHPDIVLGHSLGEYSALVQAGVLALDDALRLVRTRGLLMERASDQTPGGMLAVVQADLQTLEEVVDDITARVGVLEITNVNGPSQVVLSGVHDALSEASRLLTERRLGRVVPLNVSAPFHSSLMAPMAGDFARALATVELHRPRQTFIDNVSGEPESDPARIREKLVTQLTHPVLWSAGIEAAWAEGGRTFIECGPKAVLGGLVKRINRRARIYSTERFLDTGERGS